jgi:16S rRNA (cytosine967-C5)-methyltransferase
MMSEPSREGLAARRAAMSLEAAALSGRGGFDTQISAALSGLDPRERAFARNLVMTLLRRRGQLARILDERLRKPPPDPVLALLRLGAAQVLFMDVADHAAVATTMTLAESDKTARPFKALINAVLRGIVRKPPEMKASDLAPDWLLARWRAAYGPEAAEKVAAAIAEEPATDLSLRSPADAADLAGPLEAEGLPGGSLRSSLRGDITGWPGFSEGRWWVQDYAAAIPARLMKAGAGDSALDLCAAPGGKTLQLAAAGAKVTALDRSPGRLKRLDENLARVGLAAEVVATPAEDWDDPRRFDAVLLDAPCSATGAFRRQPEVLWLAKPGEIAKLAEVQARLLAAGARRVKAGGRLVYSVCSLETEEGEARIAAFLRANPEFQIDPIAPGEAGLPAGSLRPDGTARILPHHAPGGLDGFYIARMVRVSA